MRNQLPVLVLKVLLDGGRWRRGRLGIRLLRVAPVVLSRQPFLVPVGRWAIEYRVTLVVVKKVSLNVYDVVPPAEQAVTVAALMPS